MREPGAALGALAPNIGYERLGQLPCFDQIGHLLLLACTDLAKHHDGLRVRICLEQLDHLRQGHPDDGIAAHVHERCRTYSLLRQIISHRRGDAPGARTDADRTWEEPGPGRDRPTTYHPKYTLPGTKHAQRVGSHETRSGLARRPDDHQNVVDGNAIGHDHEKLDARIDRLERCAAHQRRGNE